MLIHSIPRASSVQLNLTQMVCIRCGSIWWIKNQIINISLGAWICVPVLGPRLGAAFVEEKSRKRKTCTLPYWHSERHAVFHRPPVSFIICLFKTKIDVTKAMPDLSLCRIRETFWWNTDTAAEKLCPVALPLTSYEDTESWTSVISGVFFLFLPYVASYLQQRWPMW